VDTVKINRDIKYVSSAYADVISGPPLKLLCQLHLMWITSPVSLNVYGFLFVSQHWAWNRQTDGWEQCTKQSHCGGLH